MPGEEELSYTHPTILSLQGSGGEAEGDMKAEVKLEVT